jgi:hypothetical protein
VRALQTEVNQIGFVGSLATPVAGFHAARLGQGRGGAHEGRHARGWGHPNPWRQRLRAAPSRDERSRPSSRRDPPGGGAGRAAEGGQVTAQGGCDRRAWLSHDFGWSVQFHHSAARRRSQRSPGDGEGAAEAGREHRPAGQPRLHSAHACCVHGPPLHRARLAATLGQPRPAGHQPLHRPDVGRWPRAAGVCAGPLLRAKRPRPS